MAAGDEEIQKSEIEGRLEYLKKATQGFKMDLESSNTKLEEVKICLSEITDILELLSKTITISDQMDLSYRHRIIQDLESFKNTKALLEKLTESLSKDNPDIYKKILEFVTAQEKTILDIGTAVKQNTLDMASSLKYLRKLNCEDETGRPLTGFNWLGYHLAKGGQGALAGIIIALIYWFLRYVLPAIMSWQPAK